ncbi:MAG: M56 family metallopeptidase [Vicinamibacterales bacterium]
MTSWPIPLVHNPYLIFIGWMLLLILWETTAVGVIFAVFRACSPGRTVTRDYVTALCAFALSAAAVPVTIAWQLGGPAPSDTSMLQHQTLAVTAANGTSALRTLLERPAMDAIAAIAAVAWIVGVFAVLVRFMGGWWLTRSLVAKARPVRDAEMRRMTDALALRAGVKRAIGLVESYSIEAPVAVGWRKPYVVIPVGALPHLSRDEMSAVLAHEVAHIRRRDYAINLLQSFTEVPLFFSPAVAWIARAVREAREFCCDDDAVASIGDRRHYVEALVRLAGFHTIKRVHSAVGISGPRLVTRIRRLLQEESMPRLSLVRIVALVGALGLIAVSGVQVSAVSALRLPRQSDTSTVYKTTDPGVTEPSLIRDVKPKYTDDAKKRKVHGIVDMQAVITSSGAVRGDIRVTKSLDPGLDAEAIKAVRLWRFRPATKDGKPVNVMVEVEMTFTLK